MNKPSINWDEVPPEYNSLAQDEGLMQGEIGDGYLYKSKPIKDDGILGFWHVMPAGDIATGCIPAADFASYQPGTCDWKDSLVMRPEGRAA